MVELGNENHASSDVFQDAESCSGSGMLEDMYGSTPLCPPSGSADPSANQPLDFWLLGKIWTCVPLPLLLERHVEHVVSQQITAHHAVAFLKQQELHVEEKSSDQPDYVRDSNELLDDEECAELQQILGLQVEEEEPSSREPVAESWSLVSGDSSSWRVISR